MQSAGMGMTRAVIGAGLLLLCSLQIASAQIWAYTDNPVTYVVGSTITNNLPLNTSAVHTVVQIYPPLPAGLIFNNSDGVISGQPTVTADEKVYTVHTTQGSTNYFVQVFITVTSQPDPIVRTSALSEFATRSQLTTTDQKADDAVATATSLAATGFVSLVVVVIILYYLKRRIDKKVRITPEDIEHLAHSIQHNSLARMTANDAMVEGGAEEDDVFEVRSKRPANNARSFSAAANVRVKKKKKPKMVSSSKSNLSRAREKAKNGNSDVSVSSSNVSIQMEELDNEQSSGDEGPEPIEEEPQTTAELLTTLNIPKKHQLAILRENLSIEHLTVLNSTELQDFMPDPKSREQLQKWISQQR